LDFAIKRMITSADFGDVVTEHWARHPWMLPALSGVLLASGYFTLGLVVPNLVALVPLLVWIDANLDRPWRAWRNAGFVFGISLNLLILSWMRSMLAISFLGIFAYLGLALIFAAELSIAVIVLAWMRKRTRWSFVVLLPAVWLTLEWLQAQGDLRMTAQHLGQSLGTVPFLVEFADLAGPYGVGLVLLLSNAILFAAWRAPSRAARLRRLAAWGALAVAVLGYDAWAWTHPPAASGSLRIAFVQPNVPLDLKMSAAGDARQDQLLAELTRKAAAMKAEVVIWPETARPRALYIRRDRPSPYAMPEVQSLAQETGVTIVVGAEYIVVQGKDDTQAYNAVFVVHPDGRLDPTWAAKIYLVPFVEAIPFEFVLGPVLAGRGGWARWLAGGFSPGPRDTPLPVAGSALGISVCYEELYFDLQRSLRNAGARVQAVITNDAWFGTTFFQAYQANTVRLRAIENRSSFVRVANTGISMFVDPLGRDSQRTELLTEEVRVSDVTLTDVRTVYDRIGDVPAWAALATFVAASFVGWRRGQ
jgi:apolipoprotein N-acyltransferase